MISIFFLWLLIILLIQILFKLINITKNQIICFFISLLIILFAVNLKVSMAAAIEGANLWFKAMLPTLFPFLVICNLLISYDGISIYSKLLGPLLCRPLGLSKNCSFPLAASFLCGYPLGAKYCSDIYDLGYIDRKEYIRLLNIASNCGPLFIIGSVSAAMLGNIKFGYLLLIPNYLSLIIIGFITKGKKTLSKPTSFIPPTPNKNFGQAFKDAIENALTTTISVGGFIIIFSVVIGIIKNNAPISIIFNNIESYINLPKDSLYAFFLGSIEITNGCNILATSSLTIPLKLSIISFLCSFSGLSIIAQVSSFTSKHHVPIIKYILLKFFQGIISFLITLGISNFFLGSITTSTSNTLASLDPYMYFIPIVILLILAFIEFVMKNLFFHVS
ncbi:sporulation integral membrane protein YlbJ [Clostridium paraputrificum]|uniref:sporulation integral membrane protein YlbJ n=1 Tax=Clostridium paraputrificum TaxID=29363 RepID=UPI003D327B84